VAYDALVEAVSAAARVAPKKSTLPIASCVLLEAAATSNTLLVTATDMYMTQVTLVVPARVRRPGRLVVSARLLSEYLEALGGEGDELLVATSPVRQSLHLVLGRFRARLPTLPAEDFPLMHRPTDGAERTVDGETLKQLAARTVFAALARSPDRAIGNVLVKVSSTMLTIVAADGYRLAHAETATGATGADMSVLVPKDAAEELIALLGGRGSRRAILRQAPDCRLLEIETEAFRMSIRCGAGEFLDYEALLAPAEGKLSMANVRREDLRSVVAAQAAFSGGGGHLELVLRAAGPLEVVSERDIPTDGDSRRSDARVQVDADVNGPRARVSIASRHLREALASLTSERVELHVTRRALLLSDQSGTQHVIAVRIVEANPH
jgi:DNA polymerase-3 subunit beta